MKKLTLILLSFLVLAAAFLLILPMAEHVSSAPTALSADWMAALPDDALLTDLAIPGTHDSGAYCSELAFFSRCQGLTLRQQLEAGFRFLDVRLAPVDGRLVFFHGFCRCRTSFWPLSELLTLDAALADIYGFLDEHPGETVLFTVRLEDRHADPREFQTLLQQSIGKHPEHWLLSDTVPTLGEARGKLVLLRREPDVCAYGSAAGIDVDWTDQGHAVDPASYVVREERGALVLYVQDRYKLLWREKLEALDAGFRLADEQSGSGALRLNFCSTAPYHHLSHPHGIAMRINGALLGQALSGSVGWVIMDFGEAQLAEMIYRLNR